MKILLINPDNPAGAGRDLYAGEIFAALCRFKTNTKMYFGLPLALPTLAAVTPSRHTVKIVDEMVEAIDFDEEADLVGITAMTFKATRAYEIAREFKKRGVPVIMGGIHASVRPDEVSEHVDCVVVGEAEELWPKVLEDFEHGRLKPRYTVDKAPDISKIPPPRHDLSSTDKYFLFLLQTTRGCPYNCKFCTVTRFNGKVVRKKSPEQVVNEIESVIKLRKPPFSILDANDGKKKKISVPFFFTDDNFAIDRKHALAVCKAIEKFQNDRGTLFTWVTQVNYSVGLDDELLTAMNASGCRHLFMGFESLGSESLKAMKKKMNTPEKYAAAIQNAKRYGMETAFSVIIGGEFDDINTGNTVADFIDKNEVFYILPNIMTPYPGTVLGEEMDKEGRIVSKNPDYYNIRNVVFKPKLMTPLQLQTVYTEFCARVFDFDNMIKRAHASLKHPRRYILPIPTRIFIWILLSFTAVRLTLTGKLRLRIGVKLLALAPRFILVNGTASALGLLATSADYDDFARSELNRLDKSPASTF
ncbi:MAG: B12-binding domain-containing radical SAM protein [Proteobacteria bacterium]|nr:B12-binding domain-containing radical SAM protein [Pseudomonadota bacterium]